MTTRRGLAPHGNDEGSAVALLPILLLTLIAGVAALVGIMLQPSDSDTTPEPAPITAAQLGRPCTEQAAVVGGATGSTDVALQALATCVNARIEGALGEAAASTNSGYAGVVVASTFNGQPRVVVRWTETPPAVVALWAALHPRGVVTVSDFPSS